MSDVVVIELRKPPEEAIQEVELDDSSSTRYE